MTLIQTLVATTLIFLTFELSFDIIKKIKNRDVRFTPNHIDVFQELEDFYGAFRRFRGEGNAYSSLHGSKERTKNFKTHKQTSRNSLWNYTEPIMASIVSLIVLGVSLYVILSGKYDDGTQKWAFGVTGSIIGFWVRRTHGDNAN